MSSKFLAKKQPVEVEIDYIEFGDQVLVISNPEIKEKLGDEIKTVKGKFARSNYNLYNTIMNSSIKPTEDGSTYLNPVLFKTNKFRYLFIEMTDYTGEVIPNSRDLLINIDEDLAIAFVDAYDQRLTEERYSSLKESGVLSEDILELGEKLMNEGAANKMEESEEKEDKKNTGDSPEDEQPSS